MSAAFSPFIGHPNAAILTYYGLFALQHRGQESAGIVTADGPDAPFQRHKDMGLVAQVFSQRISSGCKGTRAIGHVRYSTTGSSNARQRPAARSSIAARGQIAIAHNGNLINAAQLRDELEARGLHFPDHRRQRDHPAPARAAAAGAMSPHRARCAASRARFRWS